MAEFLNDIGDIEVLLALSPEELAPIVLRTAKRDEQNGNMHVQTMTHFLLDRPGQEPKFPANRRNEVEGAITESWSWLTMNVLIVPAPGINGRNGFMVLARKGEKYLESPDELANLGAANNFPKALLHPSIANEIWNTLIRGKLEDAVFKAFRAVEEAVRDAGGFDTTDTGVPLMRDAFHTTTGPLTDLTKPEAEREALAHLFAGAIGSYKNPHSHRTVKIDLNEAKDMVLLASHLLRIVDSRRTK